MTDGFDWMNDATTLIAEQPETAIYENPNGQIVIRQRDTNRYLDEDDGWIVIDRAHLRTLIGTLLVYLDEAEPPPAPACRDRTAAARQRRYRQRQRDGDRNSRDGSERNGRNGVTDVTQPALALVREKE